MVFSVYAAIVLIWSWAVLRDRPLHQYATMYWIAGAVGSLGECLILGAIYPFESHMYIRPDLYQDVHFTEVFSKLLLFPLIACLYMRYAGRRPYLTAAVGAGLLGLTEAVFVRTGAMVYIRWHPAFTVTFFFVFFLIILWVMSRPMPLWVDVGSAAFLIAYLSHQLLGGAFGLWRYRLPPLSMPATDVLFLVIMAFAYGPTAMAFALVPKLHSPAGVVGTLLFILLADAALLRGGILTYTGWSLWHTGVRYLFTAGLTLAYARWQMENRAGPVLLR
ncbi:MAG TPA: hypothetical protein VD902_07610 [Symbiobacteriaceae bacterium]|nr:hypothetical protein [Symbiobacteriaceae bacterium]